MHFWVFFGSKNFFKKFVVFLTNSTFFFELKEYNRWELIWQLIDNIEILKRKFKKTDKELEKYLKKYKKIDYVTRDHIQDVFNDFGISYQEMFKPASESRKNKFKRVVEQYNLEGYNWELIKKSTKRSKIKNYEIFEMLILLYYLLKYQKAEAELTNTLKKTTEIAYQQGIDECREIIKTRKRKFELKDNFLYELLILPAYSGIVWNNYMTGLAVYWSRNIYKNAMISKQQGKDVNVEDGIFVKDFEKEQNALLHKKLGTEDVPTYMDKYTGSIDALNTYCMNKAMLQAYMDYGIQEVKFIAEIDTKTTKMCKSLDGQVFKIYGINKYTRYSAQDNKVVNYTTKGLEVGANLPPINNSFHWCRSTIIPIRNRKN